MNPTTDLTLPSVPAAAVDAPAAGAPEAPVAPVAPATPPSGRVTLMQSRTLVAQLRRSEVFRDYERAFRETTGLPITLRPIEGFDLPHHGDPNESPFCALMAQSNHSCSA